MLMLENSQTAGTITRRILAELVEYFMLHQLLREIAVISTEKAVADTIRQARQCYWYAKLGEGCLGGPGRLDPLVLSYKQ